jgi:hypothetical protein
MAVIRLRDGLLLAGGIALFVWATLPPDTISYDKSCQAKAGPPAFSETLHGRGFWEAQLTATVIERDRLLSQPARIARLNEAAAQDASPIEKRLLRLSQEDSRIDDTYERERHEAAEQRNRLERIGWLMDCEAVIRQRLAR